MGTLRNIGHHIALSVRKLLKSPRSVTKIRLHNEIVNSELNTPDSSRSVSFTEAISWPFIDEDIECDSHIH